MSIVQRQLVKLVLRVVTFPRTTLALCAILLVASVTFAWFHLTLSTDQNALLTPDLPFFKDFLDFDAKFPENEAFVVLIEPKDRAHPPLSKRWITLADTLSDNLMTLKGVVKRVDTHAPLGQLGDQALLFDEWPDIKDGLKELTAPNTLTFTQILAKPPGLFDPTIVVAGTSPNIAVRFYNTVSVAKVSDVADMTSIVTSSLNESLQRPPEQWLKGRDIPNLTDLDPKAKLDPSPYGYNLIPDETKRNTPQAKDKIMVVNVYVERDYANLADVTEPLQRMRSTVEQVAINYPEFYVGITGRPALEADEMRTSDHDTKLAETCGLILVFFAMWIFLRKLWLVIVAEVCLGTGIGWTFGWATLAVGRLNLLSLVFVIALIGIGMDYLIQILSRYRFEKKRYIRPRAIWTRVFRYVSPPISTACLGAAGAFLVANLTDFKGAGELGLIAGGGLLLCLAAGYTLLPALLTLFPADVGRVAEEDRYHDPSLAPKARPWRIVVPLIWILIAAVGLFFVGNPTFDPNLLKLQAAGLPSVKLVHKLPTWSASVMSDDLDALKKARAALTPAPNDAASTILNTDSLLDAYEKQAWLAANNQALRKIQWQPPAIATTVDLETLATAATTALAEWQKQPNHPNLADLQTQIQQLVARLRDPAGKAANTARLDAWQKAFYKEIKDNVAQFTPSPLDLSRLPAEVRDHYVSYPKPSDPPSAKPTYALYIYPKHDLWQQNKMEPFVSEVEHRMPHLQNATLTGIAIQLFHSTLAIHRAFMLSTLYALALIFLLVLLDLRKLAQTLLAISVLVLGLPMLLLAMWLWQKWSVALGHDPFGIPGTWNFANFFGLPILIGAGHEYGVFMVHRYRETIHDPRRVWKNWDVSDRALLLCAIVTTCSFGFLIGASHRGLASLGWVMAVGSACTYLATLLVLRPILQWRLQKRGVYKNNK